MSKKNPLSLADIMTARFISAQNEVMKGSVSNLSFVHYLPFIDGTKSHMSDCLKDYVAPGDSRSYTFIVTPNGETWSSVSHETSTVIISPYAQKVIASGTFKCNRVKNFKHGLANLAQMLLPYGLQVMVQVSNGHKTILIFN